MSLKLSRVTPGRAAASDGRVENGVSTSHSIGSAK
jgi:hypothetical protein